VPGRCASPPARVPMPGICSKSGSPGIIHLRAQVRAGAPYAAASRVSAAAWTTIRQSPVAQPCACERLFGLHRTAAETRRGANRRATIYSERSDAFAPDEVELLMGLANQLSYGIAAVRERADSERAQGKLQLFWHLFDKTRDLIYIAEAATGRLVDVNETTLLRLAMHAMNCCC